MCHNDLFHHHLINLILTVQKLCRKQVSSFRQNFASTSHTGIIDSQRNKDLLNLFQFKLRHLRLQIQIILLNFEIKHYINVFQSHINKSQSDKLLIKQRNSQHVEREGRNVENFSHS